MNDAEILAESFRQLGSTSAVLGGLAFTAAAAILATGAGTADPRALTRPATITTGAAVASAVCLVLASLAWSMLTIAAVGAAADGQVLATSTVGLNRPVSFAFLAGLVLFFVSVGASGWIGSRRLGIVTSSTAGLGGVWAIWFLSHFIR